MRSASTVSGPLLSVSTPASQQNRLAAVHLLTGQLLYFTVEGKSRVKEVFSQLTTYMIAQGMQDVELFALAFILDEEYFFADPESKLSKYSPKSWKSSSTYGLDQNGQPLLQLHLRVKFYVDTTKSLRDDVTRQHYYLQLRKNVAERGGSTEDDQNVLSLVALGLQADLGDHTTDTDISSELLEQYLPSKVYKVNEQKVKQTLCTLHKGHKGLSKTCAQTMFLQEAGVVHKSHLYRLRLNKSQPKQTHGSSLSICNSVFLSISTPGVQMFHESLSQALTGLFLWNTIVKLCFDRKKFELRPSNTDRLVYYTNSDEKSKRLLALCRDTHQFCMTVHPRLLDTLLNNNTSDKNAFDGLKWTNEKKSKSKKDDDAIEKKKCENGGCSDSSISTADPKTSIPKDKVPNGSISSSVELGYSHTAQNSAMSELDYSVQSAQDSSDAYLMYRHPRARAAYVDNSNQSANTSSGVYTCASYSTASKDMASASYTTENCSCSVDCNHGGGSYKGTTAAAAMQKSSMMVQQPDADSAYSASLPPDTVAASSTSADEEGRPVGHGQQAAAVDDCDGGCSGADELYDLSAAATSDSSYCVGGATTATSASDVALSSASSSKCGENGCSNRCALDGYADASGAATGGRSRSGSVVSNSGSFRGDGSDPSEGGRGALLSAVELSDLIVGRKSLQTPRKGFYPSRPTTSSTLDSDSDYVTLPPPMNFVTGAPSLSNLSLANFDCGTGTVAPHWDVRRSLDLLSNVVKFCGGHHHHHHHHQCVQVNSNNYLDVHKSGAAFYHHIYPAAASVASVAPPLLHARQPPPPPPPPRPKRFDLQLEQYKQQLRSDVDFVVYPLQDPAVSRQEYVDAKLTRGRRHQYHRYYGRDPPSYQAKAHLYRSTPNVAVAVSPPPPPPSSSSASSSSLSHHHHHHHHLLGQQQQLQLQLQQQQQPPPLPPLPPHLKYASNQNLLFPATVAASADYAAQHHHHRRHRLQPLPLPVRTYSHDDLLAASSSAPAVPPKVQLFHRRPPPPPPPVTGLQKPAAVIHPRRPAVVDAATTTNGATTTTTNDATTPTGSTTVLDIMSLREKSRNLDLPLISALCNDQTLLKQTNALVTENKATQTVATSSSSLSDATAIASSLYRPLPPLSLSSYHPPPPRPSSAYQPPAQPSSAEQTQPSQGGVVSTNKPNCTRCTNGTSSYSSPPPPSFMSVSASPAVVPAAAVKTAKSKTNHVKTNTNII
ncbi:protein expanded [Myzus persicae]|uniref:protein expanded n=1 Tax=Myzus persicae TaxID=13164 RepID=UPI000B938803|nr:protein expanded [Myzus persicae]